MLTLFRARSSLGEGYQLKELFNDLWEQLTSEAARIFLDDWLEQVEESGITAFKEFAKTVKAHLSGIINFYRAKKIQL